MKILIVRTFPNVLTLNTYNVQEIGLAMALTVKGHQCDIVLYNGQNADKKDCFKFERNGKNYQISIYWLKGFGVLKNGFMPSLKKILPEYDVIQVHEYDQITSWGIYTQQKKPTIIYHGPYFGEYAKGYNLKCRLFDHFFLRRREYSNVIAVTKSELATDFLYKKGFKRVITAGVGINPDNFGEHADEDVERNKSLLYVGKIEERRNVYFLIDVFRKLHRNDKEIKLILIGNGERNYKKKFLESINKEVQEGSIIFIEKATQRELVTYYQKASAFLFTSNYEIFGMVLLEAMYFGLPVISSVNGGSTTLIRNGYNGYVLSKFDRDEWCKCIEGLMHNRTLFGDISKNAQNTIKQCYTWDALADKFLQAYQLAIKEFSEQRDG